MIVDTDELALLRRENAKLRKINAALMSRVERAMDQPNNAFGLFEVAISLDKTVRRRTAELQAALRSVERTNEALAKAKGQAEQANAFKSTFLAFVSHDLLQPLNAARLNISTLVDMKPDPTIARFVHQIDLALTNLEELIRTLLDISKLDAGVMRPEIGVVELERVLSPLREEFAPLAASKGLKLTVRPSRAFVRSDPLMLRRILQNLLTNALRYTRRGGVLLGCRPQGDRLRILVADTGPGIARERREAIFEEFQRETVAGDQVGFGLGLSIVRRLAIAIEAPVELASRLGHGSTFSISLPLELSAAPTPLASREGAAPAAYGVGGAEILLVENEYAVAEAMRALLERWSCRVLVASSLQEARETLRGRERGPDLIIADVHLDNGACGFEVIDKSKRKLKRRSPPVS